ncbi:MAG: DUF998 domain-containing protein [Thaumarchaeota archaeon]|nr:DUF998 domain-containing protein [Nitrososphaerota archaeon]
MNRIIIVGLAGVISAWITVLVSILINPWFSITNNALSDLGGGGPLNGHPYPTYPNVYNLGLIITSIIILIFCILVIKNSRNKLEITGGSFFMISALFLALIGIYHEGTYPHDFVSLWFFVLASISYLVIGFSALYVKKAAGVAMILLIIVGWILFALIPWQSVA